MSNWLLQRFGSTLKALKSLWAAFTQSTELGHFTRIYKEATPVALITVVAELIAGIYLAKFENYYLIIPGLLLIVPGMMESRGNIITSLSKRLGTSVHLGLIKWEYGVNKEIVVNLLATIILNVLAALGMGIMGFIASVIIGIPHISLLGFVLATLFMAVIVGTILAVITVFVVVLAYKLNFDPDNVTIPVIATIGDILTISFIVLLVNFLVFTDKFLLIIP